MLSFLTLVRHVKSYKTAFKSHTSSGQIPLRFWRDDNLRIYMLRACVKGAAVVVVVVITVEFIAIHSVYPCAGKRLPATQAFRNPTSIPPRNARPIVFVRSALRSGVKRDPSPPIWMPSEPTFAKLREKEAPITIFSLPKNSFHSHAMQETNLQRANVVMASVRGWKSEKDSWTAENKAIGI